MPKAKDWNDLSLPDQLRQAVLDAERQGVTRYRVAKDAGLSPIQLNRFMNGERDLRLEVAARLTTYFSMRLTRPKVPRL